MKGQFNVKIQAHREQQHLSLWQVAALHERRTARLSKIEKGLRHLKRERIPTFAHIPKAGCDELMRLSIDDQIYGLVKDEKMVNEEMKVADKKIKLKKRKK
jgi:hypothetical protein